MLFKDLFYLISLPLRAVLFVIRALFGIKSREDTPPHYEGTGVAVSFADISDQKGSGREYTTPSSEPSAATEGEFGCHIDGWAVLVLVIGVLLVGQFVSEARRTLRQAEHVALNQDQGAVSKPAPVEAQGAVQPPVPQPLMIPSALPKVVEQTRAQESNEWKASGFKRLIGKDATMDLYVSRTPPYTLRFRCRIVDLEFDENDFITKLTVIPYNYSGAMIETKVYDTRCVYALRVENHLFMQDRTVYRLAIQQP